MSFLARLFGRRTADTQPERAPTRLSAETFRAQHTPDALVVDVRTPSEYAAGHLAGARLADVTAPDFEQRIRELAPDPTQPVYLYCRSGNRSAFAAERLLELGYTQAVDIGGFDELRAAGLPTEP